MKGLLAQHKSWATPGQVAGSRSRNLSGSQGTIDMDYYVNRVLEKGGKCDGDRRKKVAFPCIGVGIPEGTWNVASCRRALLSFFDFQSLTAFKDHLRGQLCVPRTCAHAFPQDSTMGGVIKTHMTAENAHAARVTWELTATRSESLQYFFDH